MNDETGHHTHDRSVSKARFLAKFQRYGNLLRKRWWVLALGIALGVAVQLVLSRFEPVSFTSVGRMIVSIKLAIPEGSVYTEELSNFLGTQAALMQSGVVINQAHARLASQRSDFAPVVGLKVSVLPKTTIFVLQGTGADRDYTQAFLQAAMEEYVNLKREMRVKTSDTTFAGLTEEVLRLEKDLSKAGDEMVQFQSTNSVVLLQDQGNSAGNYLGALNNRLASLKSEYELLQTLTLDQNLDRQQQLGGALPANDPTDRTSQGGGDRTDSDYLKAKQQILLLTADQQDLAQFLRPKHPKMMALSEEIARRERLLDIFRKQSAEQLESRKRSLACGIL